MQPDLRLARISLAVFVSVILAGVWIFRPFYGLMDDASHLFALVPAMDKNGIFAEAFAYARRDLGWGMFRFTYPLMVYPLYKAGMLAGAPFFFFVNALFSLFCAGFAASSIARVVGVRTEWAWLALASFFYQYDLLQHPSLQEKLILLFGALLIRMTWGPVVVNRFVHALLFGFAFLLGVGAKASFMIYLSMALWCFGSGRKEALKELRVNAWLRTGIFALAVFAALVFFAVISAKGTYTHQFDLAKVPGNVVSPAGILFLLPITLFVAWVVWDPRSFLQRPERLTAFWGVCAFLAIFLPWGIQAYVQSVIGPAWACLCVQLADGLFRRVPRRFWQVPLAMLAMATALYRVPTMFFRLHDIGRAVEASAQWEQNGIREIYMPCVEGAESMQQYLREFGHSGLKVIRLEPSTALEGKAVFFDLALCPLPGRSKTLPGCDGEEELFRGSLAKSFRLVRGKGCH